MLCELLLKQLNELRLNNVLCDLELIATDHTSVFIHKIIWTALNRNHFQQTLKTAEHAKPIPLSKMFFTSISGEELNILVEFLYGVIIDKQSRYDSLVSALNKLGMTYLLEVAGEFVLENDYNIKTEKDTDICNHEREHSHMGHNISNKEIIEDRHIMDTNASDALSVSLDSIKSEIPLIDNVGSGRQSVTVDEYDSVNNLTPARDIISSDRYSLNPATGMFEGNHEHACTSNTYVKQEIPSVEQSDNNDLTNANNQTIHEQEAVEDRTVEIGFVIDSLQMKQDPETVQTSFVNSSVSKNSCRPAERQSSENVCTKFEINSGIKVANLISVKQEPDTVNSDSGNGTLFSQTVGLANETCLNDQHGIVNTEQTFTIDTAQIKQDPDLNDTVLNRDRNIHDENNEIKVVASQSVNETKRDYVQPNENFNQTEVVQDNKPDLNQISVCQNVFEMDRESETMNTYNQNNESHTEVKYTEMSPLGIRNRHKLPEYNEIFPSLKGNEENTSTYAYKKNTNPGNTRTLLKELLLSNSESTLTNSSIQSCSSLQTCNVPSYIITSQGKLTLSSKEKSTDLSCEAKLYSHTPVYVSAASLPALNALKQPYITTVPSRTVVLVSLLNPAIVPAYKQRSFPQICSAPFQIRESVRSLDSFSNIVSLTHTSCSFTTTHTSCSSAMPYFLSSQTNVLCCTSVAPASCKSIKQPSIPTMTSITGGSVLVSESEKLSVSKDVSVPQIWSIPFPFRNAESLQSLDPILSLASMTQTPCRTISCRPTMTRFSYSPTVTSTLTYTSTSQSQSLTYFPYRPKLTYAFPSPTLTYVSHSPTVTYASCRPTMAYVSQSPSVTYASCKPTMAYVSKSPSVTYASCIPRMAYVSQSPSVIYASCRPTMAYVSQSPTVTYASCRPTMAYVSQNPSVTYASCRPTMAYVSQSPLVTYASCKPTMAYISQSPTTLTHAFHSPTLTNVTYSTTKTHSVCSTSMIHVSCDKALTAAPPNSHSQTSSHASQCPTLTNVAYSTTAHDVCSTSRINVSCKTVAPCISTVPKDTDSISMMPAAYSQTIKNASHCSELTQLAISSPCRQTIACSSGSLIIVNASCSAINTNSSDRSKQTCTLLSSKKVSELPIEETKFLSARTPQTIVAKPISDIVSSVHMSNVVEASPKSSIIEGNASYESKEEQKMPTEGLTVDITKRKPLFKKSKKIGVELMKENQTVKEMLDSDIENVKVKQLNLLLFEKDDGTQTIDLKETDVLVESASAFLKISEKSDIKIENVNSANAENDLTESLIEDLAFENKMQEENVALTMTAEMKDNGSDTDSYTEETERQIDILNATLNYSETQSVAADEVVDIDNSLNATSNDSDTPVISTSKKCLLPTNKVLKLTLVDIIAAKRKPGYKQKPAKARRPKRKPSFRQKPTKGENDVFNDTMNNPETQSAAVEQDFDIDNNLNTTFNDSDTLIESASKKCIIPTKEVLKLTPDDIIAVERNTRPKLIPTKAKVKKVASPKTPKIIVKKILENSVEIGRIESVQDKSCHMSSVKILQAKSGISVSEEQEKITSSINDVDIKKQKRKIDICAQPDIVFLSKDEECVQDKMSEKEIKSKRKYNIRPCAVFVEQQESDDIGQRYNVEIPNSNGKNSERSNGISDDIECCVKIKDNYSGAEVGFCKTNDNLQLQVSNIGKDKVQFEDNIVSNSQKITNCLNKSENTKEVGTLSNTNDIVLPMEISKTDPGTELNGSSDEAGISREIMAVQIEKSIPATVAERKDYKFDRDSKFNENATVSDTVNVTLNFSETQSETTEQAMDNGDCFNDTFNSSESPIKSISEKCVIHMPTEEALKHTPDDIIAVERKTMYMYEQKQAKAGRIKGKILNVKQAVSTERPNTIVNKIIDNTVEIGKIKSVRDKQCLMSSVKIQQVKSIVLEEHGTISSSNDGVYNKNKKSDVECKQSELLSESKRNLEMRPCAVFVSKQESNYSGQKYNFDSQNQNRMSNESCTEISADIKGCDKTIVKSSGGELGFRKPNDNLQLQVSKISPKRLTDKNLFNSMNIIGKDKVRLEENDVVSNGQKETTNCFNESKIEYGTLSNTNKNVFCIETDQPDSTIDLDESVGDNMDGFILHGENCVDQNMKTLTLTSNGISSMKETLTNFDSFPKFQRSKNEKTNAIKNTSRSDMVMNKDVKNGTKTAISNILQASHCQKPVTIANNTTFTSPSSFNVVRKVTAKPSTVYNNILPRIPVTMMRYPLALQVVGSSNKLGLCPIDEPVVTNTYITPNKNLGNKVVNISNTGKRKGDESKEKRKRHKSVPENTSYGHKRKTKPSGSQELLEVNTQAGFNKESKRKKSTSSAVNCNFKKKKMNKISITEVETDNEYENMKFEKNSECVKPRTGLSDSDTDADLPLSELKEKIFTKRESLFEQSTKLSDESTDKESNDKYSIQTDSMDENMYDNVQTNIGLEVSDFGKAKENLDHIKTSKSVNNTKGFENSVEKLKSRIKLLKTDIEKFENAKRITEVRANICKSLTEEHDMERSINIECLKGRECESRKDDSLQHTLGVDISLENKEIIGSHNERDVRKCSQMKTNEESCESLDETELFSEIMDEYFLCGENSVDENKKTSMPDRETSLMKETSTNFESFPKFQSKNIQGSKDGKFENGSIFTDNCLSSGSCTPEMRTRRELVHIERPVEVIDLTGHDNENELISFGIPGVIQESLPKVLPESTPELRKALNSIIKLKKAKKKKKQKVHKKVVSDAFTEQKNILKKNHAIEKAKKDNLRIQRRRKKSLKVGKFSRTENPSNALSDESQIYDKKKDKLAERKKHKHKKKKHEKRKAKEVCDQSCFDEGVTESSSPSSIVLPRPILPKSSMPLHGPTCQSQIIVSLQNTFHLASHVPTSHDTINTVCNLQNATVSQSIGCSFTNSQTSVSAIPTMFSAANRDSNMRHSSFDLSKAKVKPQVLVLPRNLVLPVKDKVLFKPSNMKKKMRSKPKQNMIKSSNYKKLLPKQNSSAEKCVILPNVSLGSKDVKTPLLVSSSSTSVSLGVPTSPLLVSSSSTSISTPVLSSPALSALLASKPVAPAPRASDLMFKSSQGQSELKKS